MSEEITNKDLIKLAVDALNPIEIDGDWVGDVAADVGQRSAEVLELEWPSADAGLPRSVRIAAASYASDALFGIAMLITLRHLARTGELPMTPWGFRAFSGPFEDLGQQKFAVPGLAFVGLCAVDVVAGVWLWQGQRLGARLGLAMTPVALILGGGFALPFLLVPVPVRAGLVLAGRRRLR